MKIPAPGRIISGLHVQTEGTGTPLVVLEAGIAASSVSWSLVQTRIAQFTTVLSYDRAGFGWSDPARLPCTAAFAACQLAMLLKKIGAAEPVVLVGHSFGGLIARRYQQQFPRRVAGLVLVDPVIRAEWRPLHFSDNSDDNLPRRRMLERGVMLSRRGATLARAGVVGFALKMLTGGSQRIPKLLAKVSAGNGAGVTDRLVGEVRKMPRELWPAIAQHWSQARSFDAMAQYLENLPRSAAQLDERRTLEDLPLQVLSASKAVAEHEGDTQLSSRGQCVVVPNAGHWIQLDAPDAVIEAVRKVVTQVRSL